MHRLRRCAAAAVLALTLVPCSTASGPCAMRAAPSPSAGGDHGCCGDGLRAAVPPCCRVPASTAADAASVRRAAPPPAIASVARWAPALTLACPAPDNFIARLVGHDPPPLVLRV